MFVVCRDGEDELYYNMLLEEEPEHKLQVTSTALANSCLDRLAAKAACRAQQKHLCSQFLIACFSCPFFAAHSWQPMLCLLAVHINALLAALVRILHPMQHSASLLPKRGLCLLCSSCCN
jgi:hypothetical protein